MSACAAEGLQPAVDRRRTPGIDVGDPVGVDEPGCLRSRSGRDRVMDGLIDEAVVGEPRGGPIMEIAQSGRGRLRLQLAPSDCAEQVVEAIPPTMCVERHQELVGALEVVQYPGRIVYLQGEVAQRRREPFEQGDADDEVAELRRQTAQHLFGEVVAEEPVIATELVHERIGVFPPTQRHGRQVQPGRPALGALHQLGDGVGGELDAFGGQQSHGRVDAEAEAGRPGSRRAAESAADRPSRSAGSARVEMTSAAVDGRC